MKEEKRHMVEVSCEPSSTWPKYVGIDWGNKGHLVLVSYKDGIFRVIKGEDSGK